MTKTVRRRGPFSSVMHEKESGGGIRKTSPEAETIRRAQNGDTKAFDSIYQQHSPRVYGLCLRMVKNPADAEDLTQDAFLLVLQKLHTFRGESAFSTWLHRVVINTVLMYLRKKKPGVQDEPEKREEPALETEIPCTDRNLAGLLDRVNLKRAVVCLSPPHRAVFVLHDVQGFNHSEIAGMMDLPVGTSKSYLHRARKRLRSLLQGNEQWAYGGENAGIAALP
jgi:RNA polymerase sigma-70 factor, ECF subfamily